jgi:hypothetical protein
MMRCLAFTMAAMAVAYKREEGRREKIKEENLNDSLWRPINRSTCNFRRI